MTRFDHCRAIAAEKLQKKHGRTPTDDEVGSLALWLYANGYPLDTTPPEREGWAEIIAFPKRKKRNP